MSENLGLLIALLISATAIIYLKSSSEVQNIELKAKINGFKTVISDLKKVQEGFRCMILTISRENTALKMENERLRASETQRKQVIFEAISLLRGISDGDFRPDYLSEPGDFAPPGCLSGDGQPGC